MTSFMVMLLSWALSKRTYPKPDTPESTQSRAAGGFLA
jgi:hypothetical protein